MFAVIEFNNLKKEYSVVPLIWLSDDKTFCFWPKNVTSDKHLQMITEALTPPKDSWTKFPIRKVHKTTETFSEANSALQLVLTESSTSASDAEKRQMLNEENMEVNGPDNESEVENNGNSEKENSVVEDNYTLTSNLTRKATRMAVKKKQRFNKINTYSSDSDSEVQRKSHVKKKKKIHQKIVNFSFSSDSGEELAKRQKLAQKDQSAPSTSGAPLLIDRALTPQTNTIPLRGHEKFESQNTRLIGSHRNSETPCSSSIRSSPSTSIFSADHTVKYQSQNQFEQKIIEDLARIKAVQEQQSTLLAQIWQTLQVKNVQALQRPPDVPDLPIDRKRDFGHFEKWLENQQNYLYMRTRLASIGGTTVRSAVMNIMKFIMSNKLGMAFNWAGSVPKSPTLQRKHAFKETMSYKVINEATKICFQGKDQVGITAGDITDKTIGQACQDWLKLSKQRYLNTK